MTELLKVAEKWDVCRKLVICPTVIQLEREIPNNIGSVLLP